MGFRITVRAMAWLAALALGALAQTPANAAASGQTLYEVRCKGCHEAPVTHAPNPAALRTRPKPDLVKAMTEGAMSTQTLGMTPDDIAAIADYLTGAGGSAGRATVTTVDTPCATHPPITPSP